jgi:hypothetical protein
MNISEYTELDGCAVADLITSRQVKAEEVHATALEAIGKVQPELNALAAEPFDAPLDHAESGRFAGTPFGLKDLVCHASGVRVHHFPGRFACDRYAAARRRTSFSCSNSRIRLRASPSSAFSVAMVPGLIPSSTSAAFNQLIRHDSLIPKSAAICFRR